MRSIRRIITKIEKSPTAYHLVASLYLAGAGVYFLQVITPNNFLKKYSCNQAGHLYHDMGKLTFMVLFAMRGLAPLCIKQFNSEYMQRKQLTLLESELIDVIETLSFTLILAPQYGINTGVATIFCLPVVWPLYGIYRRIKSYDLGFKRGAINYLRDNDISEFAKKSSIVAEYSYHALSISTAFITIVSALVDAFRDPEADDLSTTDRAIVASICGSLSLGVAGLAMKKQKYWRYSRFIEGMCNSIYFSGITLLSFVYCFFPKLLSSADYLPQGLVTAVLTMLCSIIFVGIPSGVVTSRNPYQSDTYIPLLKPASQTGYSSIGDFTAATASSAAEPESGTIYQRFKSWCCCFFSGEEANQSSSGERIEPIL